MATPLLPGEVLASEKQRGRAWLVGFVLVQSEGVTAKDVLESAFGKVCRGWTRGVRMECGSCHRLTDPGACWSCKEEYPKPAYEDAPTPVEGSEPVKPKRKPSVCTKCRKTSSGDDCPYCDGVLVRRVWFDAEDEDGDPIFGGSDGPRVTLDAALGSILTLDVPKSRAIREARDLVEETVLDWIAWGAEQKGLPPPDHVDLGSWSAKPWRKKRAVEYLLEVTLERHEESLRMIAK